MKGRWRWPMLVLVLALAAVPASGALADPGGVQAGPWSLDLANAPLRAVFDQLAQACGMVLDYDSRVRTERRMSLSAHGGDPDVALHYALRASGLALQPVGQRAMRVVPGEALAVEGAIVIGTASLLVDVAADETERRPPAPVHRQPALARATAPGTAPPAATPGGAIASHGAQLDWKIRPRTRVGSNFTVQLLLRSERPVASAPMTIAYDQEALEVVRIEAGDYLGAQPQFNGRTSAGGVITIETARTAAAPADAKTGLLASITFRATRAADAATIQVTSARMADASGAEIPTVIPFRHAMPVQP